MKIYKPKTEKDFKFIASLFNPRNSQFMYTKTNSASRVRQTNTKAGRSHYILAVDERKIGWFNIRKASGLNEGIFGMIINKPFQGKGYGRQAIILIEKEAKKLGIKKLKLQVFVENKRAINLYKKSGFKESGRLLDMEKKI